MSTANLRNPGITIRKVQLDDGRSVRQLAFSTEFADAYNKAREESTRQPKEHAERRPAPKK